MLHPGNPGIGVYFGRLIPRSPIFFPIASNGSIALLAALLTHFPAMNAIQTNTRAIISIIMVPNILPVAERALFVVPVIPPPGDTLPFQV